MRLLSEPRRAAQASFFEAVLEGTIPALELSDVLYDLSISVAMLARYVTHPILLIPLKQIKISTTSQIADSEGQHVCVDSILLLT